MAQSVWIKHMPPFRWRGKTGQVRLPSLIQLLPKQASNTIIQTELVILDSSYAL